MQCAILRNLVFGFSTLGLVPVLHAQVNAEEREPMARIGQQPIYEQELTPLIGGQLLQLRNQEYELKLKALETLVSQRLLEAEARNEGVPVETLLDQKVDRNLPPWSISEFEGYYLALKDRLGNKPLAEVKQQLEQAFLQSKRQQARQVYIDQLRQNAGVTILLSRPRVEIAPDLSRLRGNPDAPVTIVEFADFQCPYCGEMQRVLTNVMDKYKGKLRLGFRDFPLRQIHPQAQPAAEASRCAGEQGKFWEYHDLLYANQATLGSVNWMDQARLTGLNVERFSACLASGKFKSEIENDLQLGAGSGVSATPTFYVNGTVLVGSQPLSAFEKLIETELATAKSTRPAQEKR